MKPVLRTLGRLFPRALPVMMGFSLFATGLVAPSPARNARPVVADRVQALADRAVRPGFSRSADTGHPTQLVGFEWEGAEEGAVEVRARENGRWSEWHRLEGDPTEGPDEGSREHTGITTAGPAWVGRGVRQVEVRVAEGELSGLKLHAIRSEEPPPPPGATEPAGAQAQPGIVSRAGWGADESYRFRNAGCGTPEYAPTVRLSFVHHTVNSNSYTAADSPALMRGIYHFHTHTNKWCDIGYNFLVDRFGTVFEGRYGGISAAVVGAHAAGFNSGSTGVAVLGTFVNDPVPSPAYGALRSLLAWKLSIHGVDPRAVISFNGRNLSTVSGHRDVNSTECPGGRLYDLLPQLRNELGGMVSTTPRSTIVSAASNKLVDVWGASQRSGAAAIQWPANGGPNQQWRFEPLGGDVYRIVAVHSGQVLDVYGASTSPGADVIQWPWTGGANQRWRVVPVSSGLVQLVSVNSGMVLDVYGASTADGAKLIQWPWHGGANQQWSRRQL